MDTFIEKLVTRRRGFRDNLVTSGILAGTVLLILLSLTVKVLQQLGVGIFLAAGFVFLGYRLIAARNIEFEYIVTNGELDIDKIIAQRKRKRIFSASCKEFEILSPVKSNSFSQSVQSIKNRIDASGSIDSPEAYFATLNYKGNKTLLIFEPDEKMLNNFKIFIPRKINTVNKTNTSGTTDTTNTTDTTGTN
jgi:hypothetical protein